MGIRIIKEKEEKEKENPDFEKLLNSLTIQSEYIITSKEDLLRKNLNGTFFQYWDNFLSFKTKKIFGFDTIGDIREWTNKNNIDIELRYVDTFTDEEWRECFNKRFSKSFGIANFSSGNDQKYNQIIFDPHTRNRIHYKIKVKQKE